MFVKDNVREKSGGTFLWVALVCNQLQNVRPWETRDTLTQSPSKLEALYELMLERVQRQKHADLCIRIICSVTHTPFGHYIYRN
jgi:hypothetical protein